MEGCKEICIYFCSQTLKNMHFKYEIKYYV